MIETMEMQRHASDADLIRLLDTETTTEDAGLGAHVTDCAECTTRLTELRRRSDRLSALLRATDVPPVDAERIRPPFDQLGVARMRARRRAARLWMRPGVRAAAGLVLLAGVAAASPAARTWVLERVARLRTAPAPAPVAGPPTSQAPRTSVGATVFFAPPPGGELAVRFDERQAVGSLELMSGDDDRASAQVTARAGTEALLVLPGELRVRNGRASTADYRLTLPASVRRVRIHVGPGASPVVVDLPPGARRIVELARDR
jgi:hypothetical protein